MRKILWFTYGVVSGVEDRYRVLARAGEEMRQQMPDNGFCIDRGMLVVSSVEKGWSQAFEDFERTGTRVNTLWHPCINDIVLVNAAVEYDHAFMPSPVRDVMGGYEWMNGESCRFGANLQRVVVTCSPIKEIVQVSIELPLTAEADLRHKMRHDFMEIMHDVERTLKQAKAAYRLEKAIESPVRNVGRIRRFINELMLAIARR